MDKVINEDIKIFIEGMGIVFYSDYAVKDIKEGEDFFKNEYENPYSVGKHIRKGDIVGFCTGSGGDYILKFRSGKPSDELKSKYPIGICLAIIVDGGTLYIKDLFDLMEWSAECPKNQILNLDDGIYEMRVHTTVPASGFYGDDQIIYIHLNKVNKMPELPWCGVPPLYKEFEE